MNTSSIVAPAVTEVAHAWNHLYGFLFIVCAVFFVIVMVPLVIFMFRYRHRPGRKSVPIDHNQPLEILWTAIPTVIVMVVFAWGWLVYEDMQVRIPSDAMEIRVLAKSWNWTFQYEDGRMENNKLFVPVNKPVKLVMTSQMGDVLHSFFVPNFRLKKDVVPGLYTTTWFKAEKPGRNILFCAEYCGLGHSAMWGEVVVLPEDQWELWKWGKSIAMPEWIGVGGLSEKLLDSHADASTTTVASTAPTEDLAHQGLRVSQKMGCTACHSDDGSTKLAPSFKGVYGKERIFADGKKLVADENYLRESIVNPQAKVVKGFSQVMPPYTAAQMNEIELSALVAYIKSLQ